jgi:diguanylate cyclase (GGDEF)-like protein/PAS domain S-box-containing protein
VRDISQVPPNFAYSTFLLVAGMTCLLVAIIILQSRRNSTGATALAFMLFALAWWDITYGLFWFGAPGFTKYFWLDVTYVGVVIAPPALFIFVLQLTNNQNWLKSPLVAFLYLEPILVLLGLFTDSYHGLFFAGRRAENGTLISHGGLLLWFNVAYSYGLLLISTVLIVKMYLRSLDIYRRQFGIVLFGVGVGWLNNIALLSGLDLLPGADSTPFSFTVTAMAFAFAIGKYRLLDLIPVAKDSLIERMTDGVLVIDMQNRIVDMNPSVQRLLSLDAGMLGLPVETVAMKWTNYEKAMSAFEQTQVEVELDDGDRKRLDLQVAPIVDDWGNHIGRLITLHDVTGRREIEEEEKKQRILAQALQETSQALNSTLDYESILEKILVNIGRVVPVDSANIALLGDDGFLQYVRFSGYMEYKVSREELSNFSLKTSPIFKRIFETGEPVIISDTHADPDWIATPSGDWIRSYAAMPIRIKERVVGVLNLDSGKLGFYTAEHLKSLRAFADQVAVSIENARLFAVAEHEIMERKQAEENLRRDNEYHSMLHQVTVELLNRPNPESLLNNIAERAAALVSAQHGFMFLSEGELLILRAATKGFSHNIGRHEPKPGTGVLGKVWQKGESFVVENYTAWELHNPNYDSENLVAIAGVPIKIGGDVIGVLEVANTDHTRPFSPAEIEILERFALLASLVLDNTQLFASLQAELEERVQMEVRLREANAQLETQMKQIKGLQMILREQVVRDPLTGLFNRRYLNETQDRELARAAREGYPVCFAMIDIDRFKGINDKFGHEAGDQVLRKLSALIQDQTRGGGIICRYGGEEILAILPNVTDEVAFQITERWRQAFMDLVVPSEAGDIKATISCGISIYPVHGTAVSDLISLADKAMYQAKAAGRNRVVVWRPES